MNVESRLFSGSRSDAVPLTVAVVIIGEIKQKVGRDEEAGQEVFGKLHFAHIRQVPVNFVLVYLITDSNFDIYVRNVNELSGRLGVYNMLGQAVWEENISGGKTIVVPMGTLRSGQYVVKYIGDDSSTAYTKVIVTR